MESRGSLFSPHPHKVTDYIFCTPKLDLCVNGFVVFYANCALNSHIYLTIHSLQVISS